MSTYVDPYASSRETTEGTVFAVTGGDWDSLVTEIGQAKEERVVVNMGPQHPSTHGVLRLVLELEGETVTEVRCGIGSGRKDDAGGPAAQVRGIHRRGRWSGFGHGDGIAFRQMPDLRETLVFLLSKLASCTTVGDSGPS